MKLSSPAFEPGQQIPREYTGDGHNNSPPLVWSEPPPGTRSLALVCEDPDTPKGAFIHWVVLNLPVEVRELDAGIAQESSLPSGAAQGANGLGRVGYDGPAPPPGKPHHYFFRLYALDAPLELPAGSPLRDVRAGMEGHVLAEGELMGTYQHVAA